MGTLTVYFVGICTHLREFTSREVEHRVVLVNARESKTINEKTIVAHEPSLRYTDRDGTVQKMPLNGVHITTNAVDPNVAYDVSYFTCIPRLTPYAPDLQSLGMDMAKGRNASLAAAYFDAAGRFLGRVDDNGASVAMLSMATQDPPTLRLVPFDGSDPTELQLPDDAVIQLENVGPGKDKGDGPQDFLLHFLVATGLPSKPSYPTEPAKCPGVQLPFPSNTVDVGCSNSNYP